MIPNRLDEGVEIVQGGVHIDAGVGAADEGVR